jgi:organic radical activating enzyme
MGSPLTKYMLIALLVLATALTGAIWLSYKFYGEREVAVAQTEQLSVAVSEEKVQTDKALKSAKLADKAIVTVQKGEAAIDVASEKLQAKVSKPTPSNPTKEVKDEATEACGAFLGPSDIRLLKQSHCLSDGDPSNCGV